MNFLCFHFFIWVIIKGKTFPLFQSIYYISNNLISPQQYNIKLFQIDNCNLQSSIHQNLKIYLNLELNGNILNQYFLLKPNLSILMIYLAFFIALPHLISSAIWKKDPSYNLPDDKKKQLMLKLINQVRSNLKINLPSLYLDDTLNILAEKHSEDMIKRKYFDHVCPDKKGVAERAKDIGFKYRVGQNIAISGNVIEAHEALMKSPGHYNNTIDPEWFRCGIGFKTNSSGRMYTTIVFAARDLSKLPVTNVEKSETKKQISRLIREINGDKLTEDQLLSDHINNWLIKGREKSKTIMQYLKSISYSKPSISYTSSIIKLPWTKDIKQKLRPKIGKQQKFRKFGVNLKQAETEIQILIVYASK